jgi:hypothetical protein
MPLLVSRLPRVFTSRPRVQVVTELQQVVDAAFARELGANIAVIYVCGSDHFRLVKHGFRREGQGVAVLQRVDQPNSVAAETQLERRVFAIPDSTPEHGAHLSSTAVRQQLKTGGSLEGMVSPGVAEYLYGPARSVWDASAATTTATATATTAPQPTAGGEAVAVGTAGSGAVVPSGGGKPRVVFISLSALKRFWREVPAEVMESAVFFFGSKRYWVFPADQAQRRESTQQPTDYRLEKDLEALILRKEAQGLVHWLKPPGYPSVSCSFQDVSTYFQGLLDPVTGMNYGPLILDLEHWRGHWTPAMRFSSDSRQCSAASIIENIQLNEHDYGPVIELLHHSLPTLLPVLSKQGLTEALARGQGKKK